MLLKNKVKKWLSEGLITQTQGEAILDYEKTSKSAGSSWIVYGFLIVAVFSAGLGIIALIAANWRAIPVFFKLTGYFLILGSVGFFALRIKVQQSKTATRMWFEPLLIFFMIVCMAGIGLISQIYNIKGESYQALFFWSFITCGLMALSRESLTMYIWLAGLYMACIGWMIDIFDNWDKNLPFKVALLHPLFFLLCSMLFHNRQVIKTFPALVFKRRTLEEWTLLTGFISLTFFHAPLNQMEVFAFEFFLVCLLGLITLATVFISGYKKIQKYLLSCILFLFFLFYFVAFSVKLNSLVLMIFSSLMLALSACFFATLRKINLFMFFVFALIVRILFFYISLFKSLTLTGLILVLMSIVIVAMIQLMKKNKEKITHWLEQLE